MSKAHVDSILFFSYATSPALFLQNQQEKTIMTGSNAEEIAYSLFYWNRVVHRLSMIKTVEFSLWLTGVFITALHFCNNALHLFLHTCQLSHFQLDNSHFSYLFLAVTYFIGLVRFVCPCTLMQLRQRQLAAILLPQGCDEPVLLVYATFGASWELSWALFNLFNLKAQGVASCSIFWLLALH